MPLSGRWLAPTKATRIAVAMRGSSPRPGRISTRTGARIISTITPLSRRAQELAQELARGPVADQAQALVADRAQGPGADRAAAVALDQALGPVAVAGLGLVADRDRVLAADRVPVFAPVPLQI